MTPLEIISKIDPEFKHFSSCNDDENTLECWELSKEELGKVKQKIKSLNIKHQMIEEPRDKYYFLKIILL